MLNLRNKSVNVSRSSLLIALRQNLELYREMYQEAVADYKVKLKFELEDALKMVSTASFEAKDAKSIKIDLHPPVDHSNDYIEVIEMLEVSVDENINLDVESFRAFFKNEWSWSAPFDTAFAATKIFIEGHQ